MSAPSCLEKWTVGTVPVVSEDDLDELKNYLIRTKPVDLLASEEGEESRNVHLILQMVPLLIKCSDFVDGSNNFKVVSCEVLSLWFLRSIQLISSRPNLTCTLSSLFDSEMASFLFQYILDFWNESGAALGNLLKELFVKLVSFINKTYEDKVLSQSLFESWLLKILGLSPNMKVVYFMVEHLSKEISNPFFVLEKNPSFPQTAIELMWSNALAFPVGKSLYAMYRNILNKGIKDESQWLKLWDHLVINGLKNQNTRRNVETCLLPHMFKISSKACREFIKQIGDTDTSILLGCLRIAQNLAIIEEPFDDDAENAVISFPKICELIMQQDVEEFRIDAFKILVSSAKGSQPVKPYVFEAVYSVLDVLFLEDSVGTRYELFSSLKQFITRSRDAAYALDRDAKKMMKKDPSKFSLEINDKMGQVRRTQEFFQSLLEYSLKSLRPGSSYQKITSAQKLLINLIKSGLDSTVSSKFYDKHHIDHPYTIPIYGKTLIRLLIDNIDNDYEDIRQSSTLILSMAPMHLDELIGGEEILNNTTERALEMLNDMKGRKADSGARFFQFIFTSFQSNDQLDKCWEILHRLSDKIQDGTGYASRDLASAVYRENVHGYYASIKFIFEVLDFKKFNKEKMTEYVNQLIDYALVSWETIKDVLQHHSPEGNLPEEMEVVYTSELEEKYGKGTQVIASYSWRTLKESTSFFKVIFSDRTPEYLLSDATIVVLGDVILTQLSTVRHRGALSSVYPTFIACCERCISSSNPQTRSLPLKWLNENIEILQTRSSKHITRRSAGIPYFITAILVANKSNKAKDTSLMQRTISELLKIASKPVDLSASEEDINLPQVNGFNCIKAIFTESLLSDLSIDFVSDALELSLNNFGSSIWAIRNSALMLFTALQNKLFGNKKTTNNQLLPTISARLFFTRFKKVRGILWKNLTSAVENGLDGNNENDIQRVFPILTILSRLDDTSVDYRELAEFEKLIYVCLESKYWKVREMTARTLPCLISDSQMYDTCTTLLSGVFNKESSENLRHGNMLGIKELISIKKAARRFSELAQVILSKASDVLCGNYSYPVKLAYLQIISLLGHEGDACISILGNWFIKENEVQRTNPDGSHQLALKECSQMLLQHYLVLKDFETLRYVSELCFISSHFEVIIAVIHFYSENMESFANDGDVKAMLFANLWTLTHCEYWSFIKSNALSLLRDLLTLPECGIPWTQCKLIKNNSILESYANDEQFQELRIGAVEVSASFVSQLLIARGEKEQQGDQNDEERMFDSWFTKATELSRDVNPVNVRRAALNSLNSFQKVMQTDAVGASSKFNAQVFALIFNFLFDDSNELRESASSIISRDFLTGSGNDDLLPFITAKRFIKTALLTRFSRKIVRELVNDSFGFQADFQALFGDFKSLFIEDSLLFTVEKQNFYVNDIERYEIFVDLMMQLGNPRGDGGVDGDFIAGCKRNLETVTSVIRDQQVDGHLGWCNEKVFCAISCVLLSAKLVISLHPSYSNDIILLLKDLQNVMDQRQIHPLLETQLNSLID